MTSVEARAPAVERSASWRWRRNLPLYFMLLPAIIGLLLFSYYPMYGVIIAFQDYDPLRGFNDSPWVGLRHFEVMFSMPDTWLIIRNTAIIAIGKIVLGQLAGVTFALLLHEIQVTWYKRMVQTLSYLLHFLSWIIFGGMLLDILALNGIVNGVIRLTGLPAIFFLGDPLIFPPIMILTDSWKEFGWSAIIYLAALTGIDPTLYEAAAVDGASRWQRMRNVTLPGITSTIILLACLSLGWILSAGFEQILVLYNPVVYETGDIIDTYVYRAGLLGWQYSLGTAVGLLKSVVGFVLIVLSFWIAGRVANYRIL